jgi:predicted transcriptional regulator
MKMPCEITVWNVLPVIRRELACVLVDEYKMSQAEVSRRFGLTEAAISQYMKKKRGGLDIPDKEFKDQIIKSAKIIFEDDDPKNISHEVCLLCNLIKKSSSWDGICGYNGNQEK